MIETFEKTCLSCGTNLRGRRDKKFCSDQCRATHNYRINFESSTYVKRVNNLLRKNWRILHELNPEGKNRVHEDELRLRQFNFNYFTSVYKTQDGNCYYYCYDQGYLHVGRSMYLLVEKKV